MIEQASKGVMDLPYVLPALSLGALTPWRLPGTLSEIRRRWVEAPDENYRALLGEQAAAGLLDPVALVCAVPVFLTGYRVPLMLAELRQVRRVNALVARRDRSSSPAPGTVGVGWYVLLAEAEGAARDTTTTVVGRNEIAFEEVDGLAGSIVDTSGPADAPTRYIVELDLQTSTRDGRDQTTLPRRVSVACERVQAKCDTLKRLPYSWYPPHYVVWTTAARLCFELPCWLAGALVAVFCWRWSTLRHRLSTVRGGRPPRANTEQGEIQLQVDVARGIAERHTQIHNAARVCLSEFVWWICDLPFVPVAVS